MTRGAQSRLPASTRLLCTAHERFNTHGIIGKTELHLKRKTFELSVVRSLSISETHIREAVCASVVTKKAKKGCTGKVNDGEWWKEDGETGDYRTRKVPVGRRGFYSHSAVFAALPYAKSATQRSPNAAGTFALQTCSLPPADSAACVHVRA